MTTCSVVSSGECPEKEPMQLLGSLSGFSVYVHIWLANTKFKKKISTLCVFNYRQTKVFIYTFYFYYTV